MVLHQIEKNIIFIININYPSIVKTERIDK
jgi:hypothetical protein